MAGSDFSRRNFLKFGSQSCALSLAQSYLPSGLLTAAEKLDKRLMVVIMRGALDGLAAVPPIGDKSYVSARGQLALPQNSEVLLDLNGFFAMHSALKPLYPLYQQREMLVMHAVATPYRERSHFDAQNLLENGSDKPFKLSSGWLNRAITGQAGGKEVIAMGSNIPLLLRGDWQAGSWSSSVLPDVTDEFLERVQQMYKSDPILSSALGKAIDLQSMTDESGGKSKGGRSFVELMGKAAEFMGPSGEMRIGTAELGGWDTHANQGLDQGPLARNMGILAEGIATFKEKLGSTWNQAAVLCITEFGRTVRANGSGGTDHGTASVAFLIGGRVNGGRVIGEWPGLSQLYQGRDLYPANDLRTLIKATLNQHLGISNDHLSQVVFPQTHLINLQDKLFA